MLHAVAMGLYLLDCVMLVAFAGIYLVRGKAMPYHLEAMGCSWDDVPPRTQLVVVALMRAAGSAYLALSLAMGTLVVLGLGQRVTWANAALLTSGLALLIPLTAVVAHVRVRTGARSPIVSSVAGLVFLGVAFCCELLAT
jgi:hypothetical protein